MKLEFQLSNDSAELLETFCRKHNLTIQEVIEMALRSSQLLRE
ncbi:MAG: hypothetical protein NVSMB31_17170 [Vulcanimicrobiaceae bacterium]